MNIRERAALKNAQRFIEAADETIKGNNDEYICRADDLEISLCNHRAGAAMQSMSEASRIINSVLQGEFSDDK